jgi:membrane-associated phospholipid phosphatase
MLDYIKYIGYLGFYGPNILFFLSFVLLLGKNILLGYYIFGFLINIILNVILKAIIKQPRPDKGSDKGKNGYKDTILAEIMGPGPELGKGDVNSDINSDVNKSKRVSYGMPSKHAQMCFYSLVFILFALRSHKKIWLIILFYLIISINTIVQRVQYKEHTLSQVLAGALVGSIVSYGIFNMATSKLYGQLRYKPDDYALL